jgi:hypothetical protein
VDLQPVKDEEGAAAQLTKITRGSMIQSNPNVKGEIGVALARVLPPFNGPGVFYTTTLDVPASAPPGTVYKLDFTNVVIAGEHGKLAFTPVSGTLTVVPTKSPLPPVEQPALTGTTIGVGRLYAHRGTKVTVEVFAGDGLKGVAGVQAKLKFREVKVGKRKKTPATVPGTLPTPPNGTENREPAPSTDTPG